MNTLKYSIACYQYLARVLQDMQRYDICTNYTIKIIMVKS